MTQIQTGAIGIDDVRAALAGGDPGSTNASKLRTIIGRGSFATIQRHLDAIRAEAVAAAQPASTEAAPAMPDAFKSLWDAAHGVALASVRVRLDAVVQERDEAAAALESSRGDVAALAAEIDASAASATAAIDALDAVRDELVEQDRKIEAQAAAHALALADRDHRIEAGEHALALAQRDGQIAAAAMQTTIDRLTDQVAELKSLLHELRNIKPRPGETP